MSSEALSYIRSLYPGKAKRAWHLLRVIAEHVSSERRQCCVGQHRLAFDAGGVSIKTVHRHLKCLEAGGFITRWAQFNHDGGRAFDRIEIAGFDAWLDDQQRRDHERTAQSFRQIWHVLQPNPD